MSNWINHVKNYAEENNISYKEALTEARTSYQQLKGGYTGRGLSSSKQIHPELNPEDIALIRKALRRKEAEDLINQQREERINQNIENRAEQNIRDRDEAVRRERKRAEKEMLDKMTIDD